MKKRVLSLALLLGAGAQIAFAQGRMVSGKVVNEKGEPLPGASVETVDGRSSTFTSSDGTFEIEIPEGASTDLKITSEELDGTYEKIVSANEDLSNIELKRTTSLEGVVVTGYRTITKEKYVGAADNIGSDYIEKMPVADVTRAIEGAAPGLQFAGGGEPGTGLDIRIRGFGSVTGSSSPLVVVDGTPYAGDITSINPNDIENVTILKDATATSLYGSRGANGVIVITTKKGRSRDNSAIINIDLRTGLVQRGIPNYDVITDEAEYYEMAWRAYYNNLVYGLEWTPEDAVMAISGDLGDEYTLISRLGGYNSYDVPNNEVLDRNGKINPNARLKYHDNWDDEVTRRGTRNEANMSVSYGDNKNDYYFSLGYLKENGFIKYSDYERFNGRINVNSRVKDYLKVGLNLSGTISNGNYLNTSDGTSSGNPMFISKDWAPIFPVYYYNENGEREIDPLTGEYKYDWGAKGSGNTLLEESSVGERPGLQNSNVLGSMAMDKQYYKTTNIVAIPYAEIYFLKDFTFNTMLSYNYYDQQNVSTRNKFYGQFAENGGYNYRYRYFMNVYTFRQQLSYNKALNDKGSSISAFAAHENYDLSNDAQSGSATGIPFPNNYHLSGAEVTSAASSEDVFRMESYVIGVSYIHERNLFIDGSVRWDGTSRFSVDNKKHWNKAPFWALGVGYNLKSAEFLREVDFINSLKVKASYGTQGNQNIGSYYVYQTLYGLNFPHGNANGALITGMGNADLQWEAQGQFNAGVEFTIWKNRLNGEVNFFNRSNSDMLFMVPTAPSLGIQEMPMNVGNMYNRGVEVTLGAKIFNSMGDKNKFDWNITVNATHFKNKITKMPESLDSFISGSFMRKEGHSIYDFYIVEHAGVSPYNGAEYYYNYDAEGNKYIDSVWANVSSSGRRYHGSALPDLYGSIVNNMSWKGFDLSFTLTYGIGGDFYDGVYQSLMRPGSWGKNWHRDVLNSWTETNPSDLPRLEINSIDIGNTSTRFLTDASYLNIRNISLGYTLPAKVSDKLKIHNVRIYALFDNVHMFTARKGMNPQASFSGTNDFSYTPARTMMLGVKFDL